MQEPTSPDLIVNSSSLDADSQDLEARGADMVVDTSGTRCPIPLLRAKQALKTLAVGEIVQIISTDPSSVGDFDAMLKHLPHTLVDSKILRDDNEKARFIFSIRKG